MRPSTLLQTESGESGLLCSTGRFSSRSWCPGPLDPLTLSVKRAAGRCTRSCRLRVVSRRCPYVDCLGETALYPLQSVHILLQAVWIPCSHLPSSRMDPMFTSSFKPCSHLPSSRMDPMFTSSFKPYGSHVHIFLQAVWIPCSHLPSSRMDPMFTSSFKPYGSHVHIFLQAVWIPCSHLPSSRMDPILLRRRVSSSEDLIVR